MSTKLTTVFQGSPVEAEIIKQILADNGIEVFIKNQLMGTIAPWQVSSGGFNPVELEVFEEDQTKSLELIETFSKSK